MTDTAVEQERAKLREVLTEMLRLGFVEIEFDKIDGTVRTINATLLDNRIPHYEKKTDRVRVKRDDQITVVDTASGQFRNIKLNAIRNFTFHPAVTEKTDG